MLIHPMEGMQPAFDSVHVKQGHKRAAHHFGKKGDMLLNIAGHDGDMVDAAGLLLMVHSYKLPCLTLTDDKCYAA